MAIVRLSLICSCCSYMRNGVNMEIREISDDANEGLARLIRYNFEVHKLAIPGTVYFDAELDCLSEFYNANATSRKYFVLWNEGKVSGGAGFAEFSGFDNCAELQKLYLVEELKGLGIGKKLLLLVEKEAKKSGYTKLYLETHSNFDVAIKMYKKYGYKLIKKPENVSHGAMNTFMIKEL